MDDSDDDDSSTITRIYVKPLLVLDLNGILCHRVRRRNDHNSDARPRLPLEAYRPQVGPSVAQTAVIPRPDLASFLLYLAEHFCLAIWTSAKAKTAKTLVELLVPEAVARKLLFVWSQNHCRVDPPPPFSEIGGGAVPLAASKVLYKKDLEQAWTAFPLWNRSNTLFVDDSPNKCAAWAENAVHPPPLHGRRGTGPPDAATDVPSDEENVARQQEFFARLVKHWNDHPTVYDWDTEADDATVVNGDGQLRFLREHAAGYMRWRT